MSVRAPSNPELQFNQSIIAPLMAGALIVAGQTAEFRQADVSVNLALEAGPYGSGMEQRLNNVYVHGFSEAGLLRSYSLRDIWHGGEVRCAQTSYRLGQGADHIMQENLLVRAEDGGLLRVLSEYPQASPDNRQEIERVAAAPEDILNMAREVGNAAIPISEPVPWAIQGKGWGSPLAVKHPNLVPGIGRVLQLAGTAITEREGEDRFVRVGATADVGSSGGRLYHDRNSKGRISINTFMRGRGSAHFDMEFYSIGQGIKGDDLAFVTAGLEIENREGNRLLYTRHKLEERLGRVARVVTRQRGRTGEEVKIGEYEVGDNPIVDLARVALLRSPAEAA